MTQKNQGASILAEPKLFELISHLRRHETLASKDHGRPVEFNIYIYEDFFPFAGAVLQQRLS